MSFKTWKKEFYPVSAARAAQGSALKAIEHSLRKWEGVLLRNLKVHGVGYEYFQVKKEGESSKTKEALDFDADTCALCVKATKILNKKREGRVGICTHCPIVEHIGHTCIEALHEPIQVVRLLRKVRKAEIKKNARKAT